MANDTLLILNNFHEKTKSVNEVTTNKHRLSLHSLIDLTIYSSLSNSC